MESYIIKVDDFNWIEMEGTEVIDIANGDIYAGCRCSVSTTGRYDKERKKILCGAKDSCCNSVLSMLALSEKTKEREVVFPEMIDKQLLKDNESLKSELYEKQEDIILLKETVNQLKEQIKSEKEDKEEWEDRYYRLKIREIEQRIKSHEDSQM